MCNKLVQSFACGHTKTICSTPCVHALRQHRALHSTTNSTPHHQELPAPSSATSTGSSSVHTLARSDSVKSYASSTGLLLRRNVSKLVLVSKGTGKAKVKAKAETRGDGGGRSRAGSDASVGAGLGQSAVLVPGTGRGRGRGMAVTTTTPAMAVGTTTPTRTQTTPTTPWPSISPSTPRPHQNNVQGGVGGGPGLGFAVPHSAVSSTSVDAPVPVSSLSPATPVSPFTPVTATTATTASPSVLRSGSGPGPLAPPENIEPVQNSAPYGLTDHFALGDGAEEPLFCDYYFPRCLTASQYPCRECYGKEEWEGLRKKWIKSYRLGHPMDVLGDAEVERLSGVVLFVEAEGEGKVELEGVGKAV